MSQETSRERAQRFLAGWDPEGEELPDWVADALDEDPSLASQADPRYRPWEGRDIAMPKLPRPQAPRRRRLGAAFAIGAALAASLLAVLLVPGAQRPAEPGHAPSSGVALGVAAIEGEKDADKTIEIDGKLAPIAGGQVASNSESKNTALYWRYKGETAGVGIDGFALDNTLSVAKKQPPGSEQHTDYGVNGFQLTASDALSTLSIDVDTASYTIARRKLLEGYLPPKEAVRVEEFVNYLPYDYDRPPDGAPFGVDFAGAKSPFGGESYLVRVGIQGKRVPVDQRKSVHLTFLVDTSGSMSSDDKLGLVKYALQRLTEELVDGDTVSIVAYAGSAGLVLPPTPMSRKSEILSALSRLSAGGSTAMGQGIALAYQQAEASYQEGAVNRVVLLSDGDANVGVTSHEALVEMIHGYAQRGIALTTAGFGTGNYKDTMMEQLADKGDGNYYYIDSEKQAERVFVEKLTGTLVVIAKDVKIQVQWDPDAVKSYRLLGYENRDIADGDFRDDAVDAGEIGSGHQVTAIYEIVLAEGARGDLAAVKIRSKAPGPDAPATERSYTLPREALRDSLSEADRDLQMAVASAALAERLRGSPYLPEASYTSIAEIARKGRRPEYPEDEELAQLVERAAQLGGP